MLRLENIPPEEMPEVVHIASELYERDKEQDAAALHRQATVDAAEEVGLPEEYLHRAAAELQARRIVKAQQRRRKRAGLFAAIGAAAVLGLGGIVYTIRGQSALTEPATVAAEVQKATIAPPFAATSWVLMTNNGTRARSEFTNGTAVIKVKQFVDSGSNNYFANLNNSDGPKDLTGVHAIAFNVQGTLPHVRLYLQNGNERWRSPLLPAQGAPQRRVNLNQFERQTRTGVDAPWRTVDYQAPRQVGSLSFKTGSYVNDVGASGEITLSGLRFE
jgi:hypothetical protein